MSAPENFSKQSAHVVKIQAVIDQLKQSLQDQSNALAKASLTCRTPGEFQNGLCVLHSELEQVRKSFRECDNIVWWLLDSKEVARKHVQELLAIIRQYSGELDGLFWDLPLTKRPRP
jgi:hypothetical protein